MADRAEASPDGSVAHGRRLTPLAWGLWSISAVLCLADVALASSNRGTLGGDSIGFPGEVAVLGLVAATVGALVASRVPGNAIGWLFCVIGLGQVASIVAQDYAIRGLVTTPGSLPGATVMAWLGSWFFAAAPVAIFVLLLFPNGRLPSSKWRPVAWLAALGTLGLTIAAAIATAPPGREDLLGFHGPDEVEGLSGVVFVVAGNVSILTAVAAAVCLVLRLRSASGDEREQLKWFVFASSLMVLTLLAVAGTPERWQDEAEAALLLAFAGIPVAAGIAVLKYRLYDIDVVINKTLVFGVLAAVVTSAYVLIVVGIGAAIGRTGGSNVGVSLVATAVVAVVFQPVRLQVRRIVNRLVYGERATPYEVLAALSQRMAAAVANEEVLPEMARALAAGTGATTVEIWLRIGPDMRIAASWPEQRLDERLPVDVPDGDLPDLGGARTFGVYHRGELLGALAVSKPSSDPLTPADVSLISNLASQTGLVLRNVGLTAELSRRLEEISAHAEELQRSRQRIVAAQDEERHRLERNLHDGAQQDLVALAINLALAEGVAKDRAPELAAVLAELKRDTQEALENLRDLARGIYPPTLADRGLGAALTAQAAKAPLPVEVVADDLGRYERGIEAAVYFCCLEALQNVSKYAHATRARVELSWDGDRLRFCVSDDGVGFDPDTTPQGSGLQGISDRLAALGGELCIRSGAGTGTEMLGSLPAGDSR